MNVRPLHDRIIVQRLEEGEQRVGGIIIPDSAKEKPQQGKVLAAGLGKSNDDGKRVPLDVKAGDTILFGKYSGQEIKLDGVEYLIMKEDDVLARSRTSAPQGCEPKALTERAREDDAAPRTRHHGSRPWQTRLPTATRRGRRFCAASTAWPTR